jgi:toxin ParE1/3/4
VKIRWLAKAERDLLRQLDYVAERDPHIAAELADKVRIATSLLAEHPRLGRAGRVRGTRELTISRTPYIVVYRVYSSAVRIVRVLHGAQQWPPRRSERRRPRGLV